MIMSRSNAEGITHFEVVTTSDLMDTKDDEGMATLNAEAAGKFISPNILAHLGGQVTHNEATAALERKTTFSKFMKSLRNTEHRSMAMPETM